MTNTTSRSIAPIFDPTRLRIARQAAMMLKKDLAEHVGVSPAAISQYENGSSTPSPKVVAALALALRSPVAFFGGDRPLGEVPAATPHFRSLRSTTQQERDRAFAHAILTWEVTRVAERHVRLPVLDIPQGAELTTSDPLAKAEQIAREVRQHWDLGSGPIPNVVRLLESRGVVCTRLPAQTGRVFAFSCAFPVRPVVVLSTERAHCAAGRFDAAHELGHLLVHHDAEPGTHSAERQANAFAAEFLTPTQTIKGELPRTSDWKQLLALKRIWGVSIQALLYRARTLGVMSETTYRRAVTELNARGWRRQEPGDDGRAESPVLLTRAFGVMADCGLSLEDVANEARLSPATVRMIIEHDERPEVLV